jgi:quercetin dioxygenase-like cupin family protein
MATQTSSLPATARAESPFVGTADVAWTTVAAGVRRQVLGHGPDLMLVRVEFERDAVGAVHHHPHRQVTYVAAGRFAVQVGEARRELGPGDSFFTVADVPHGVVALEAGTLIDVFTPAREEFLAAGA